MKALFLMMTMVLFLTGCASHKCCEQTAQPCCDLTAKNNSTSSKKNPISIAFYKENEKPTTPYKVVGKETVSQYNLVGIKRQEASIHDAMRDLAASMGGDAIIDVVHDDKTVSGTVIGFEDTKNYLMTAQSGYDKG